MIAIKIISHSGLFTDNSMKKTLTNIFSSLIEKNSMGTVEVEDYTLSVNTDPITFTKSKIKHKEPTLVFLEANLGYSAGTKVTFSKEFFQEYMDSKFILYSGTKITKEIRGKNVEELLGKDYVGNVTNVIGVLHKPFGTTELKNIVFTEEMNDWMAQTEGRGVNKVPTQTFETLNGVGINAEGRGVNKVPTFENKRMEDKKLK